MRCSVGSFRTRLYVILFVFLCLSSAYKPEVIALWRATHANSVVIGERNLRIPFPWAVSSTSLPAKARPFATLWPTWKDDDVDVLFEKTPADQERESDEMWVLDRHARFTSGGYKDIRNESFGGGTILCSEVPSNGILIAYCRSKANINLIYRGSGVGLQSATALMPAE
jgi:hypothetical protein